MAKDNFTDDVVTLAVASCLVSGLQKLLLPEQLAVLDSHTVRAIAGDSERIVEQRKEYKDRIAGWKKARNVLPKYTWHSPRRQVGKSTCACMAQLVSLIV